MVCEKVLIRNSDQGVIMILNKILKNTFLVVVACLALSACATKKVSTQMQGDVYTGTDTVEYLASGVADRVFFATNESDSDHLCCHFFSMTLKLNFSITIKDYYYKDKKCL